MYCIYHCIYCIYQIAAERYLQPTFLNYYSFSIFSTCRDAVEALLKYEASTNIPDFAGVLIMFSI
jgi:hypothetical protein